MDNIEEVEQVIKNKIESWEVYVEKVIFTSCLSKSGTLAVTFCFNYGLHDFLRKLDYDSLCDKSGYLVVDKTNTVILTDMALTNFISKED